MTKIWYERPPFYNSNFSIPNGSASPFGEAQLDDTKLRSDGNGLLQKRPATLPFGHNDPDALGDSSE